VSTILVTNDDGVQSPGLLALVQALRNMADVVVLAPESNWSASSHAKTMDKPLRVRPVTLADGSDAFACSGSPTDCVALAAGGVLNVLPDLVVAGINAGHNLGIDVSYSGTVACAKEATIKRIPGIAMSTVFPGQTDVDLDVVRRLSADVACTVAQEVLARGLPPETLLNVNVPGVAPSDLKGIHITRVGHRRYDNDELIERKDPYGQPYYWVGGARPNDKLDEGTDVGAIARGFVSVTPITLDMTDHSFLSTLQDWSFEE
jgi:5'-nucleotidase